MMRATLGLALLGILVTGCQKEQPAETAAQGPSVVDAPVAFDVVTSVEGVEAASSAHIVLDGQGSTGTVMLGLADGRRPVITVGASPKDDGLVVEAVIGDAQQELSYADAKRLADGETLTVRGEGPWEGIVVAVTRPEG